MIRVHDLFGI